LQVLLLLLLVRKLPHLHLQQQPLELLLLLCWLRFCEGG